MKPLSLPVVCARFPNKRGPTRLFEIALCLPGEPVNLVPEPDNKADEHAIAVFSVRGVQMGYLPSERAVLVKARMRDAPVTAIFQEKTSWGAIVRVAFNGETPVLPPARPTDSSETPEVADPDSGFWPDEIPPDD